MLASFSVAPMEVQGGVKDLVAEMLRIVEASGLDYELGAMQATAEGDAERVMETILACHRRMLGLAPLVLMRIAIDDRRPARRNGEAGRQGAGRGAGAGQKPAPKPVIQLEWIWSGGPKEKLKCPANSIRV